MQVSILISNELQDQFIAVKKHRDTVLASSASEDKDKVAALNSVTSILKDLIKVQESVYNTEKIAQLQQAVITALKEADEEIAKRVIESMGAHLCSQ